jgi:hypothetical protein
MDDKRDRGDQHAYWMTLQLFSIATVKEALSAAADASPSEIPSAQRVRELAVDIHKRAQEEKEAKRKAEERLKHANQAPDDPDQAEQYVADADNEFERLARQWEAQSKKLELEGNSSTPTNVGKGRMRAFWNLWEQTQKAEQPQPPPSMIAAEDDLPI